MSAAAVSYAGRYGSSHVGTAAKARQRNKGAWINYSVMLQCLAFTTNLCLAQHGGTTRRCYCAAWWLIGALCSNVESSPRASS